MNQDDFNDLRSRVQQLERDMDTVRLAGWILVAMFAAKIVWDWWAG